MHFSEWASQNPRSSHWEVEMHNYIVLIYVKQMRNNSNNNKRSLTIAYKYLVIQNA